jgi:glycosyltransferase involved in cell wall biosynthesis
MIRAVDPGVDVTLVANGVDMGGFEASQISQAGPLRVLCVARLIERKGQHHLIEAARRLADAGVDVAVELVGTGDAQPELRALAGRLGVSDRVRFTGYVPRERIAQHYAAADVFALPSAAEGMSVATLEAMAAGLPTVVTRTGGVAELVAEGASGLLFDWGDVDTLAAHLRRLAEDRGLAARMGAAARARAALFTWDAAAERYLELFERLTPQMAGRQTAAVRA